MREDYENRLETLEREFAIKASEKERELLLLRSEALRHQELKEDSNVSHKKALIKLESEHFEYQTQIKTLTKIADDMKTELEQIPLLEG